MEEKPGKESVRFNHGVGLDISKPPNRRTVLLLPPSLSSLPLMQEAIRDGQKLTSQKPTLYLAGRRSGSIRSNEV